MSTTIDHRERTEAAPRRTRPSRAALLAWGGVAAACLVAGALAVVTLSGDDDPPAPAVTTPVPAHPGIAEHGSPRAIEGTVESPPTTEWRSRSTPVARSRRARRIRLRDPTVVPTKRPARPASPLTWGDAGPATLPRDCHGRVAPS